MTSVLILNVCIIYVIESKSGKQLWLSYSIPKFLYDGSEHDNGDDSCNDGNVEKVYLVSFLHDNESFFKKKNWDSLHARVNSHYQAWSYNKKKHKKIKMYWKFVQKIPTIKRCLLILNLKLFRSQVKGNRVNVQELLICYYIFLLWYHIRSYYQ